MNKQAITETFTSHSPAETRKFIEEFATRLTAGNILAFYGDLGSGKTFFVQQLCDILETLETPTSPTFTIVNEYHTRSSGMIYHFDFYRLEHDAELTNLGLDDYFYSGNFCFIEWADKIERHLPTSRYNIRITAIEGEPEGRVIEIEKR